VTNDVADYGVKKAVANLPALRSTLSAINHNYLNVQLDIAEIFIDRGQLRKLAQSTITATGKHIPRPQVRRSPADALMYLSCASGRGKVASVGEADGAFM